MFCMQSLRSCSEACEQKEGIISQLRSRGIHDCTDDWFMTDISPRWGREVGLANSYPKLFWVGSCATSLGMSSEHNPESTRSLGNVAGGGRWSLLWTCNVTTGKKTKKVSIASLTGQNQITCIDYCNSQVMRTDLRMVLTASLLRFASLRARIPLHQAWIRIADCRILRYLVFWL